MYVNFLIAKFKLLTDEIIWNLSTIKSPCAFVPKKTMRNQYKAKPPKQFTIAFNACSHISIISIIFLVYDS